MKNNDNIVVFAEGFKSVFYVASERVCLNFNYSHRSGGIDGFAGDLSYGVDYAYGYRYVFLVVHSVEFFHVAGSVGA